MTHLSPPELVKLNDRVVEYVDSLIRQQAEVDLRKDIVEGVKEDFEMSPSDFKNLANERYKDKASEAVSKLEAVVELNEQILNAVRNARRGKDDDER